LQKDQFSFECFYGAVKVTFIIAPTRKPVKEIGIQTFTAEEENHKLQIINFFLPLKIIIIGQSLSKKHSL